MVGGFAANLFVSGIFGVTAAVTYGSSPDPFVAAKIFFHAPEATGCKYRLFHVDLVNLKSAF
jgi:hypothetical protein